MTTARFALLPASLFLATPALAQIQVTPPNFEVELVAADLAATGDDMAVDRFGNVYLIDQETPTSGSITRIAPDGTVFEEHATGFGRMGQLAYDPTDGFVYLVDNNPILPVVLSHVWRLEPSGGATNVFEVDVVAEGFSIDDTGALWLGGGGIQGPGLYRAEAPSIGPIGGGIAQADLQSRGFGLNAVLQSLRSGDVLIASGDEVRRFVPATGQLEFFFDAGPPIPNEIRGVTSMARTPFNQLGAGAMLGLRSFVTVSLGGVGQALSADPTGSLIAPFASEQFDQPETGFRVLASGPGQELYWYTNTGPAVGGLFDPIPSRLFRIGQLPAPGVPGSLFVNASPSSVTWDLYGPAAGGDPLLLGVALDPVLAPPLFFPPYGVIDLDPLGPGSIELIDGIGVGGPPNPFGQTPIGGAFSLTLGVPPGLTGLSLVSQGVILTPESPNGLFLLSNLAPFTLP